MRCYYNFCSCQESHPSLADRDIDRGNKKREMDDMRGEYMKEKRYKLEEKWECEWCESSKPMTRSKFLSEPFFLTEDFFLHLFFMPVIPDELKSKFCNNLNFQNY